jgi:hypothetical protein
MNLERRKRLLPKSLVPDYHDSFLQWQSAERSWALGHGFEQIWNVISKRSFSASK